MSELVGKHVWIKEIHHRSGGWGRIVRVDEAKGCYTIERAHPYGGVCFLARDEFVVKQHDRPLKFLAMKGEGRRR